MAAYDFRRFLESDGCSAEKRIALLAMLMMNPALSEKYWSVASPVMQALEPREKKLFGHWVEVWGPMAAEK